MGEHRGTSSTTVPRTNAKLTVLSVSPQDEDHMCLQAIVSHSTWMLLTARDLESTVTMLRHHEIAVVVCERNLSPGRWIDVLDHIDALPRSPSLIVTSETADDRLWAEVLNLGAWGVLAKPFDRTEVIRSVKSGWQLWHDRTLVRAKAMAAATAGDGYPLAGDADRALAAAG
ncbi:MAG: response regulator [Bryobacteraceae bacterium]|jgi:DNA-binding NtrC family response regulator